MEPVSSWFLVRFLITELRQKLLTCFFLFCFLFLSFCHFLCCSCGIWRFPGQGSNQSCRCRPTPEPQQRGIPDMSATYTIAYGNAGSITHWARSGIEPKTSWFLVRFVNHWATTGTPLTKVNSMSSDSTDVGEPWMEGEGETRALGTQASTLWNPAFTHLSLYLLFIPNEYALGIFRHIWDVRVLTWK